MNNSIKMLSPISISKIISEKKAVIFDMDGTMVDNLSYHVESWLIYLNERNIFPERHSFYKEIVLKPLDVLSQLLNMDGDSEEMKNHENEKEIIYRKIYKPHIKEIDGLTAFLELLKNHGILLAVATLGNAENVEFTLNHLHIQHFFDAITKREDVKKGKPDPEIYFTSLKKLNLSAQEALVFEDSQAGILAAKAAGIDCVGMTTSNSAQELLSWGALTTVHHFLFPK